MIKKLDEFCDIIWLAMTGVVGAVVAVLLILNWNTWLPGTKAGAFLAIIMPLHIVAVCIIILSFGQNIAHTIVGCYAWKRYHKAGKKFCYCPGHITAITMFLPAGIYLCTAISNVTPTDILGGILAMVILGVVCVPLQEFPLKKWVLKQEGNAFSFADPKYFAKLADKDNY